MSYCCGEEANIPSEELSSANRICKKKFISNQINYMKRKSM